MNFRVENLKVWSLDQQQPPWELVRIANSRAASQTSGCGAWNVPVSSPWGAAAHSGGRPLHDPFSLQILRVSVRIYWMRGNSEVTSNPVFQF